MSKKPNFIIFLADQLRWDFLGCNGNKIVKTPNIDEIAKTGTNFSKMHVASPVCMPNRASLMTGRYPSVHGLRYNGNYLSRNAVTFVDVLNNVGYQTASIGKIHLQPMTTISPHKWIEDEQLGDINESWWPDKNDYSLEQPHHYKSKTYFKIPKPYYGFQHVDLVTGHGDKCNGHYRQWLKEKYSDWEQLLDKSNEVSHNYSCKQGFRTPIPAKLYPTSFVQEKTINYFEQIDPNIPFLTFVSFPDPHHPFTPPGKYWDMYDPESFEVKLEFGSHKNPIEPMEKVYQMFLDGVEPKLGTSVFMADKRHIQESMALTAGMVTMIDDAIGKILSILKEKKLFENTVIIFASDHGDYLGHFSLMLKGALPFESITKVPFIWSDPSTRKSLNSNALASTLDIAPTILKRADIKPFWGIQGKNLLPNISNNSIVRDKLIIEYHDNTARFGFETPAFVRSLITNQYRFTLYKDEPFGELYDLKNDPDETFNLFDESTHINIRNELTRLLIYEMMENMDKSPIPKLLA